MRFSQLAMLGLVMSLSSASAETASVNHVLPACKLFLSVMDRQGKVKQGDVVHLMDAGECLGAVYAMLNLSTALTEPLKFCPPNDAEAEQAVRAIVAYIEKRPERTREDFMTLALEALRATWPCH
jgi:Rap1a immunity proteins